MERRGFIKNAAGFGLATHSLVKGLSNWTPDGLAAATGAADEAGQDVRGPARAGSAGPPRPVFLYNNWSAYDELSDKVGQTEALAMQELNQSLPLRESDGQIGYYFIDA